MSVIKSVNLTVVGKNPAAPFNVRNFKITVDINDHAGSIAGKVHLNVAIVEVSPALVGEGRTLRILCEKNPKHPSSDAIPAGGINTQVTFTGNDLFGRVNRKRACTIFAIATIYIRNPENATAMASDFHTIPAAIAVDLNS